MISLASHSISVSIALPIVLHNGIPFYIIINKFVLRFFIYIIAVQQMLSVIGYNNGFMLG